MFSRAFLNLRYGVPTRREAFETGLKRLGFKVVHALPDEVRSGDILVTWNRIGAADAWAKKFLAAGCSVLVTENASWGNDLLGKRWYHIAATLHNTAGRFPVGGDERWDDMNIALKPFRVAEGETVILPQRGIGSDPTKMPMNFPRRMQKKTGARVRPHPGTKKAIPLEQDLLRCSRVLTWGSGAAIKALMLGIRVKSYMPNWIGQQDNTEEGRLAMFRRLAWAQWDVDEISSGEPFSRLLS